MADSNGIFPVKQGLGQNGMWLAFLVGFTYLLIAQILIINIFSNWDEIVVKAALRMENEMETDETDENEENEKSGPNV